MPYRLQKSASDGFVGSVRHGRGCSHIKYYICLTDKSVSTLESADEEEVQGVTRTRVWDGFLGKVLQEKISGSQASY